MWTAILGSLLGGAMNGQQGGQGLAGQMAQAQGAGGQVGGQMSNLMLQMPNDATIGGGLSTDPGQMTNVQGGQAPQTPGSEFGGGMRMPDMAAMQAPARVAQGNIGLDAQAQQLTPPMVGDANNPIDFGPYQEYNNDGPGVLPPPPSDNGPVGNPQEWAMNSMLPSFAGSAPSASNQFEGVAQIPGMQSQPMPQGQQQQPQGGFGDLFSLTGTVQDPNMFVKLAEGYNRGGLLGALGYGLTRF